MNIKLSFLILIFFTIPKHTWAQLTVYCIPQAYSGFSQSDENITIRIGNVTGVNKENHLIAILHERPGATINPDSIFVTIDSFYPVGNSIPLIEKNNRKIVFNLDSLKFNEEDNLKIESIYIKYIYEGQSTFVGPIRVYKFTYTPIPIIDSMGNMFTFINDPCLVLDSLIKLKDTIGTIRYKRYFTFTLSDTALISTTYSNSQFDSAISGMLINKLITPNWDAIRIFKYLNDSITTLNLLLKAKELKFPVFPDISKNQQAIFYRTTVSAGSFNKRQFRIFKRNSRKCINTINKKIQYGTVSDTTIFNFEVLKSKIANARKKRNIYPKIALTYTNGQLNNLRKLLKKDSLVLFEDILLDYANSLVILIDSSGSSSLTTYSPTKLHRTSGKLFIAKNDEESYSRSDSFQPFQPEPDTRNSKLRTFNFYIAKFKYTETVTNKITYQKETYLWKGEDIMWHYKVYCVPKADYHAFKRNELKLKDLSTYACSGLASVSKKDLPLAEYYFFAVTANSKEICSKPDGPYSTKDIEKYSNNPEMTLTYSYPIIVFK